MDKKEYIKPEIVVEELEFETLMMTDSFVLNEEGGNEESLSTGRRGKWGDLWYVEEN
jgi:hypothetical protein